MPVDVEAVVRSNTRLSDDYSVVALDAPAIAERARPGQFVMVKPARGTDPLLRRPFSIFEVLTGVDGRPTGVTLLNKRVGVGTTLLYQVEPGRRLACLGPLGRPFTLIDAPAEAWLVAGGVGLAPFATLAAALRARGMADDPLLRRPAQRRPVLHGAVRRASAPAHARHRGRQPRPSAGWSPAPLAEALAARAGAPPPTLYACGADADDARRGPPGRRRAARPRSRSSR